MRTRQTVTISLPPEMIREVEKVRRKEHRTRSELIREALRSYFSLRVPVVTASPDELRALRRGRAAYQEGHYVTLDHLLHDMGPTRRSTSRKNA